LWWRAKKSRRRDVLTPGLPHFLLVGAVLFSFGTYTVLTRRNAVGILMGVELILNAANLNFVAFNKFNPHPMMPGQVFAIFVIVLAAAEAAVALAIVLAIYMNGRTIDVTEATTLKE
jgi:NADH-quinone oxidoreductase subunit K